MRSIQTLSLVAILAAAAPALAAQQRRPARSGRNPARRTAVPRRATPPAPSHATHGDSLMDALRPVMKGVAFIHDPGMGDVHVVARSPRDEAAIRRALRANPAVSVQNAGTIVGGTLRSTELYTLERTFLRGGSRQVTIRVRQSVQAVLD